MKKGTASLPIVLNLILYLLLFYPHSYAQSLFIGTWEGIFMEEFTAVHELDNNKPFRLDYSVEFSVEEKVNNRDIYLDLVQRIIAKAEQ